MLPVTAIACVPPMLLGGLIDDMSGAKVLFVVFEVGGALMGIAVLD